MKYYITNIDQILDNTDPKVMYQLFKKYTDELVYVCKDTGIFCVEDGFPIFTNHDIRKAVKNMKAIR